MWVLTILLLLASGEVKAITHTISGPEIGVNSAQVQCKQEMERVLRLNDMGFHVIAASCSRGSEA